MPQTINNSITCLLFVYHYYRPFEYQSLSCLDGFPKFVNG